MEIENFELFKKSISSGKRDKAAFHLKDFIGSFASQDEKAEWSKHYLENEFNGHKVRHEIYEQIIFPVLLDGYKRLDPWSTLWLARTIQNLYQSTKCWNQIDMKTDYDLLKELVSICPEDTNARSKLLEVLIRGFQYSIHEWPAGILSGMDGATIQESNEILSDVACAKTLDKEHLYSDFLDDVEMKVLQYIKRFN